MFLVADLVSLSIMGIQFEKLKKKIPPARPLPVKQGWVRGIKNTFKVGLSMIELGRAGCFSSLVFLMSCCCFCSLPFPRSALG